MLKHSQTRQLDLQDNLAMSLSSKFFLSVFT